MALCLVSFQAARSNGTAYATTSSVTGLAREIDGLRRDLTEIPTLKARLDELTDLVAQLATAVATTGPDGMGVASWLDLPTDEVTALAVLTELIRWMEVVYLRYSDAQSLPDCWLWHPDVVEELLWLMHAWLAAYRDEQAPVSLAADWHDRYRPGVVQIIVGSA